MTTTNQADLFGDVKADPFGGDTRTDLNSRLARWVELTERKRSLEADLRTVQEEMTAMEETLIEDMALAGMQSVKMNGQTVYRQREFYCRTKEGVGKDQLIESFRRAGLEHCLGMQWQTMRGLAREWAEAGEEAPEGLLDVVEMGDHFRLRTRKG